MDRKEFLKSCAGGLCACAAACVPAVAGDTPEDWKIPFVRKRFAKLIVILQQRMGDKETAAALEDLGEFCAAQNDDRLANLRGNVDGFRKLLADGGVSVAFDAARNVYTQSYNPGADCFCPFASVTAKTPGAMCNCSTGNTRHAWTMVLGKAPRVELKEAFLRGDKACTWEITPA